MRKDTAWSGSDCICQAMGMVIFLLYVPPDILSYYGWDFYPEVYDGGMGEKVSFFGKSIVSANVSVCREYEKQLPQQSCTVGVV